MPREISGEVPQPDLDRMNKAFPGLRKSGEDSAKIRGDMSADWKTIESDFHCNKRAAKQLFKLKYETEETRDDFLRTFLPGLVACGILPKDDLVDMMGGPDAPGVANIAKGLGVESLAAAEGAAVQ